MTSSEAESGPVQGATASGRLVEPTNSASMHSIHFILENSQEDTLVPLGVKKENSDTAKADHSA